MSLKPGRVFGGSNSEPNPIKIPKVIVIPANSSTLFLTAATIETAGYKRPALRHIIDILIRAAAGTQRAFVIGVVSLKVYRGDLTRFYCNRRCTEDFATVPDLDIVLTRS